MVKLIKIYELSPDKATAANMTSNDITKYTMERVVYWQNIFYQGSKAGVDGKVHISISTQLFVTKPGCV